MGFWYLLLLLIGIVMIVYGIWKLFREKGVKAYVMLVSGGLFVVLSVFLLMPGNAEMLASLFGLD